uniref:AAA+ ATPase domain-containing protein n=1 Tax=Picea sitchensis TaxID=3332 RepID=B8LL42_PICSI|nr:unknown [Picea sitchensis]
MNISTEPMDIDLSSSSMKSMEVSYCESEEPEEPIILSSTPRESENILQSFIKQEPMTEDLNSGTETENQPTGFQNVKKYHIIMQGKKQSSDYLLKLSVLLILSVSLAIYHVNIFYCSEELDIKVVKDTLDRKLYGQQRAIDLLIRSLDAKVRSKLLLLYGGTGVGKTYAASLIHGLASNVYHYTMPNFLESFPNDLLLGMYVCKSSILIVDDLTQYDTSIIKHVERVIEKSENLKKNITIILIYNSDVIEKGFTKSSDTAFFEFDLKDHFSHVRAYKEYIKFETLTDEHLRMCIETELNDSNVASINQIMKNFNVTLDGCKGVHSKIKFLNGV